MNNSNTFKSPKKLSASFHNFRHCGFTLTELLVVIAVIAILAAILIPVVGKVRASAHSSQCLSNLRSMQLANQIYAQENGGKYLSGGKFDAETGNLKPEDSWHKNILYFEILTNLKNEREWGDWNNDMLCPTTKALDSPNWDIIGSNYGIAYMMFRENLGLPEWGVKGADWSIPAVKLTNPSNSVAFADCTDWILKRVEGYTPEDELKNTGQGPLAFRHNGSANVVNFDASVNSYTAEDVMDPKILRHFTLE